ncbi:M23 family metallopeptidase [Streptomyces sp. NPDC004838]
MSARRTALRKLSAVLSRVGWLTFLALLAFDLVSGLPGGAPVVVAPGLAAFALDLVRSRRARKEYATGERPSAVEVEAPVTGRWTAHNSPADRVPSHGTHVFGQTYAIDIVAEPPGADRSDADRSDAERPGAEPLGAETPGTQRSGTQRPGAAWLWPLVRRNSAFPAFGAPLLAVADATVVHASDRQRDHLSRTSLPMVIYLMVVEGFLRSLGGPSLVTGNRIVLDLGDGTYAMYAHVRRGSLTVRAGDRVRAGQQLAQCGNSGNSTEPHVHFQLMDAPDLDTARGIPFRWRGFGIPAKGEAFTVGGPAHHPVGGPARDPR